MNRKTIARRQRGRGHTEQMRARNRDRGYTSGDQARNPRADERQLVLLREQYDLCPSYHSRRTHRRLERSKRSMAEAGSLAFTMGGRTTGPISYDASEADIARSMSEVGLGAISSAPTQEEFDEMIARAKRRKRGFRKYAEKQGWSLKGDDAYERTAWQVPR